jgi:hypothetical protein
MKKIAHFGVHFILENDKCYEKSNQRNMRSAIYKPHQHVISAKHGDIGYFP